MSEPSPPKSELEPHVGEQPVVAGAALEDVVAGAGADQVVAAVAAQQVVAAVAEDLVGERGAVDDVAKIGAVEDGHGEVLSREMRAASCDARVDVPETGGWTESPVPSRE